MDAPAKWEGSGVAGVFAGFRMKPGYNWDGEYFVWSLKELTAVDLHDDVKHFPPSVLTPHRTKRM
eukprot:9162261-Heterocapsa_arctica.AAC.1